MLISLLLTFAVSAAPLNESGFLPRAMTCRDPRTGGTVRVTPRIERFAYNGYFHQRQHIEVYGQDYKSRYEKVPTAGLAITPLYESRDQLLFEYWPGANWRGKFDYDPGGLSPQINFYTESNFKALTLDHCR